MTQVQAQRNYGPHSFAQIPSAEIQRSSFNRSHGHKTTFDEGWLVPIYVDEALPGDTFNLKLSTFARMSTPLHPIMDELRMDFFFFAVPVRLLWDNWQKLNGEQAAPGDSTDYLVPVINSGAGFTAGVGAMADYFGIPTGVPNLNVSALPFRAYNLVYAEWFRDQNLIASPPLHKGDGPDPVTDYLVRRRGKRHDYFTSCLPWPQKGQDVALPFLGLAPVIPNPSQTWPLFRLGSPGGALTGINAMDGADQDMVKTDVGVAQATAAGLHWNQSTGLVTDLGASTLATINELREAFQIQRLFERDARGGTRYTEIIRAHFGVNSPDARMQRPELLGVGSARININPVANTAGSTGEATDPALAALGELGAFGTSSSTGSGFVKSFTEHCVILGLVNVRSHLTYQQGLERMWSRRARFDFYWPALSHLGEQAVLNKEIFATGVGDPALGSGDYAAFGYQERYAEYRYKPSIVTGQFRSQFAQSLDTWHLAQDFAALPVLNEAFINEDAPVDRVVAVPTYPHFLLDCWFNLTCARPMPTFGVPGLIDHF